jgi:copper(I)-binding protein
VTLAPGGAAPGSPYEAAFRVGHACKDTQATTAITVRLPEGFSLDTALPRPGWNLDLAAGQVSWRAATPQAALAHKDRAEFVLRGKVTRGPGVLWFPVLQTCDQGSADWAEIPTQAAPKPEFPAARLDVLPAGVAPVQARGAWTARTVAGQPTADVFMMLSAPSGLRLLGASTPVAARAELASDAAAVGQRRAGLALPPRELVELKPGGPRILLTELKQLLAPGSTVPVTLHFEDGAGAPLTATIDVPVLEADRNGVAAEAAR